MCVSQVVRLQGKSACVRFARAHPLTGLEGLREVPGNDLPSVFRRFDQLLKSTNLDIMFIVYGRDPSWRAELENIHLLNNPKELRD